MLENPQLNNGNVKINRALISVFDKTGLDKLAREFDSREIEIMSTGGSARFLRDKNIKVTDVSDYTNFPEIMNGRVKTINPLVEGGILGLRDKHDKDAKDNNIKWIDIVICNLYPFSETISKNDCDQALALENVDIGGPTMIRSAAKNVGWVTVIVDPTDYDYLLENMNDKNEIDFYSRSFFSAKAFGHTAQYDTIIHNYLKPEKLSNDFTLTFTKHSEMRYGENPHQAAAAYTIPGDKSNNILNAKIHQGKKLSYNNIMDADAALSCLKEFNSTACVIVKHANPCGVSESKYPIDTFRNAYSCDPTSAFGVIVQETDTSTLSEDNLQVVTENNPSDSDIKTMLFGWKVLKHVKSNGILIVKDNTTVGVGAGQVSRVDSVDIAMKKSGESIKDSILCSDAFFPFRDSIDKIAGSGIKAILQPGGSVRDDEVISACNEHGIAMVFTGQRCFKH